MPIQYGDPITFQTPVLITFIKSGCYSMSIFLQLNNNCDSWAGSIQVQAEREMLGAVQMLG